MSKDYKEKHLFEASKSRDRIGDRYLHPEKVELERKHLIRDDIQRIKSILKLDFGGKVLDIGSSDGTVTIEIIKKWNCKKIVGVEIVSSAIEEANNKLKESELSIRKRIFFLESFIEELNFEDNYFNTISACETLEHIAPGKLLLFMNNLTRMLKKSGNMIVTVPNSKPAKKYIAEKRDRSLWPTHYRLFTKDSLEFLLREYFKEIVFYPLYPNDKLSESIYLICNCRNKL